MKKEKFAVVVIGAGPAGLSCALDLHESRIKYVVLEKNKDIGGQLEQIENSIRDFAGGFYKSGGALKQQMAELCAKVDLNLRLSCLTESVDASRGRIICGGIEYETEAIVLATGCRVRKLSVPGMGQVAADVFYRIEDNPQHLEGCRVAIIGGGDSALTDALVLADKVPMVYLIHRSTKLKARADVIAAVQTHERIKVLLNHELIEVIGDNGRLRQISVVSKADSRTEIIEAQRLVIRAGTAPNTELVKGQVRMNAEGYIYIDHYCATSAPGLYACGDICSPGYSRLATAIGHGSLAALAIRKNLKPPASPYSTSST